MSVTGRYSQWARPVLLVHVCVCVCVCACVRACLCNPVALLCLFSQHLVRIQLVITGLQQVNASMFGTQGSFYPPLLLCLPKLNILIFATFLFTHPVIYDYF